MRKVSFSCKECLKSFSIPLWRFRDKGKRVFCSKVCRISAMKGKKNWKWKGGISVSKKPFYWVIASEHYKVECNRCLSKEDLQVHHRDRNRENNDYQNLEFLCRSCHAKEHNFVRNFKKGSSHASLGKNPETKCELKNNVSQDVEAYASLNARGVSK